MSETKGNERKTKAEEDIIQLALRNSPFFSCLDDEQVASFTALAARRHFSSGDVVIHEGYVGDERPEPNEERMESELENRYANDDIEMPDQSCESTTLPEEEKSTENDQPLVQNENEQPLMQSAQYDEQTKSVRVNGANEDLNGKDLESSRSVYIVQSGTAGVWYQPSFNAAKLGPGRMFGEGGFLVGRQHSASVIADEDLDCWVLDLTTFRKSVLPSRRLQSLFNKYSNESDETGRYISSDDFIRAVTGLLLENPSNHLDSVLFNLRLANAYKALHGDRTDRVYLEDFCFLYLLISRPDSEVDMAFWLIDERHTGQIFLSDLVRFLQPIFPDIDYNGAFFDRYFGNDHDQSIRQVHFPQFFVDLQREIGKQAFLKTAERSGTNGHVDPALLVEILKSTCGWRLSRGVTGRLEEVFCINRSAASTHKSIDAMHTDIRNEDQYFSYGDFLAFQEVLGNLPFICNLIDRVEETKGGRAVSREDFRVANSVLGLGDRFSRRQVEIVFQLFDLDEDGFIRHDDTIEVCGVDYGRRLVLGPSDKLSLAPIPRANLHDQHVAQPAGNMEKQSEESRVGDYATLCLTDFLSAGLFGGFATALLYPIDIVKTRMMNQRIGSTILYRNALDCLQQTFQYEGISGLYRGIIPQMLCIAPERGIKLQVHSLICEAFRTVNGNSDKHASLWIEAFAGGCAGASQILVTNPLEITKIRLQMQGETRRVLTARGITPLVSPNVGGVVRALGFPGVYKGASACLLRDIPFSALYFPSYIFWKDYFSNHWTETGSEQASTLLAGSIAAIPASFITTPADVLKTRLQSIARPGEVPYQGIRDCVRTMYRDEGITSFFRGASQRVLRLSPQFGITMIAYESTMQLFGLGSGGTTPPVNVPI